jgi:arylsulfatase A-like enzyme
MLGAGAAMGMMPMGVQSVLGAGASKRRPNILFFLIDDMGWMDSEVYGSTYYESPSQQRLAREGMMFTQAYVQPLCSPTRAAIMSGQYPGARLHLHKAITRGSHPDPKAPDSAGARFKMCWPQSRSHMPLETRTVAEELGDAGYQTWFLGKWHLGNARYYPKKQGFDLNVGAGGAGPGGGYFAPWRIPEIDQGEDGEYICERLTKEACKLLETRGKGGKPFFMYFCHFNVHAPYEAKPALVEQYKKKAPGENGQRHPVMGGMLHAMDDSVGAVLKKLDELGLAEETIVIFLSDNGGVHWANDKVRKYAGVPITSNVPLRGGKCCFYEGGVRVPMIVRWPGKAKAGSRCETPVHAVDMYPTLSEIAGARPPGDKVLDGESIVPLLTGAGSLKREALYCHFPRQSTTAGTVGGSFVRTGDYKLIRLWGEGATSGEHGYELYNLREDIGESKNLAEKMPEKVREMSAMLDEWLAKTGALIPKPNPNYKPGPASRERGANG